MPSSLYHPDCEPPDDDDPYDDPACPLCGGPGVPLGQLGRRRWYRCRDCGIDHWVDAERERATP